MLLSNKNIDFLNNYKSNNINKLEINFGNNIYNNKDYCYFNKNIEQNLFFQTQTNFIKYKKNIEKIVLYNYHNYYLNISENTHIHKQNISKLDNDKIIKKLHAQSSDSGTVVLVSGFRFRYPIGPVDSQSSDSDSCSGFLFPVSVSRLDLLIADLPIPDSGFWFPVSGFGFRVGPA